MNLVAQGVGVGVSLALVMLCGPLLAARHSPVTVTVDWDKTPEISKTTPTVLAVADRVTAVSVVDERIEEAPARNELIDGHILWLGPFAVVVASIE